MDIMRIVTAELPLYILLITAANAVERESPCDFEGGTCGWMLGESAEGRYNVGRAEASSAPGPSVDAVPGTARGHYVYLNYTQLPSANREMILSFPTYQYICSLSLAYYTSALLDMSVLRVNIGRVNLPVSGGADGQWSHWTVGYNVSEVMEEDRDCALKILIEGLEMGEAEEEEEGPSVAAVDNVTLTFCLPCDFDLLSVPGNLQLDTPSSLNVSLGYVTHFTLTASSPPCPSLPLIFAIEAVEPPSLAGIFSVGRESGVVAVDATGPHLLAAGAFGYINVSVHVLGSDYTQTTPPYKATASISLEQDPVIRLHDMPTDLTVEVGVSFSLQLHAAHILPSSRSLTYHISTSPTSLQPHISINHLGEVTGVITIDTVPDILREGGANMTVGVANEFGSSLNVTIPLIFPPTPPLSLESNLTFSVSENHTTAQPLQQLATLTLVDPNGDRVVVPLAMWFDGTFELYPLGTEEDVWSWDGGLFVDQRKLDYENQSYYSLSLTVSDNSNSSLSTHLLIHVYIKSKNEHTPKFVNFDVSVRIQASWSVGSFITSEKATDQDLGPAGEVAYAITLGNENRFFIIDESGNIFVASSPLLPGEYQLTITASDHGTPPLSTSAVLTVTVDAVGQVDCGGSAAYGPPVIHSVGIDDSHVRTPVGSNATLYCSYQANPAVALYKWDVNPVVPPTTFSFVYPLSPPSPHISLLPHQLTLVGVATSDAAFYTCSVTNWCGTTTAVHILFVIDYPLPVSGISGNTVQLTSTDPHLLFPTAVNISWNTPSFEPLTPLVEITADYHLVQVQLFTGDHDDSYHDVANVSTSVTSVLVEDLSPGNGYFVRVVSVNKAGATHSDNISISLPPTTPKLSSVDTRQETNLSLLVTWEVAYDGGFPITQFTITITPQSPRERRQEGGVVYHVDPSAGLLLTLPFSAGRRYLVTLSVENSIGAQDYIHSEYVGHVDSIQCDFEPQQHCPWQLEDGSITISHSSGGVVEASVPGEGSKVILRHTAAGYSCGYGFSYQLRGGAGLQVRVGGGGGVVWEDYGDTGEEWKQVTTSQSVNVDYLTPSLHDELEMVATSNGSSGGVRLDMLLLDFCLPCDLTALHQPGWFSLSYSNRASFFYRESSEMHIEASLRDCPTAVIDVGFVRVVPSVLNSYITTEVRGHNVSLSLDPIPSDIAVQTGIIQVYIYVVGSDYASPAGDMSTAVVGVAEIEFVIEERENNCSDVISCGFDAGTCDWSLGTNTSLTNTSTHGIGVWLSLSDSHTGGLVLSREFPGESYCGLSMYYMVEGAELVAMVSGVGVVWTSRASDSDSLGPVAANFTFDLQASSALVERTVTLSLAEIWNGNGSVLLFNLTLYPCTPCNQQSNECPVCPEDECPTCPTDLQCPACPTQQTCPDNEGECPVCPDDLMAVVGGLAASLVVLLACYLCTVVCLIRRVSKKRGKGGREGVRQRLMSDSDSIGTAGSLSRASYAGERRQRKKYGESNTLMTYIPEDEAMSKMSREESSWLQAVELTHTQRHTGAEGGMVRGLGVRGEVLQNPLYEEEDERDDVEMSAMEEDWALPPPPPSHSSDL